MDPTHAGHPLEEPPKQQLVRILIRSDTVWLGTLGCLALALGVLVYALDRDASRSILLPAFGAASAIHWFGVFGQWLPSFVHPFAFSLFTAAALPQRSMWRYGACMAWCAVNMAFELGQHPGISPALAQGVMQGPFPFPLQSALAHYFLRGTFDAGDIVAVICGSLAAAFVLRLTVPLLGGRHDR